MASSTATKNVDDSERISRFLLSKRWFSKEKQSVKFNAFMPPKNLELSVACTESMQEEAVWSIGRKVVTLHPGDVTLYGRADFGAKTIREQDLQIKRDDQPFEGHANVFGWPANDESAQQMKALELAASSKLMLHPSNSTI